MSRRLTPGAARRLLDAAAPLHANPDASAVDTERYELGAELGRGGMGVVYAAFDRELGRKVALKVLSGGAGLSGQARARFVREARAAARLTHPGIATVYDATPDCIAMQLVEGKTLAQHPFPGARELVPLVRDAALAIHYAHGMGIVHRDLKPANLMVDAGERPHVYVMDFGLAKERAVDSSLSVSGSIVGTPAYMAPEQAAGDSAAVGPRTDVYGLGATLYDGLAGRAPFEGEELYPLLRRIVDEEPTPLRTLRPEIDADLATIVAKCLAKDPARRYTSALAVASDLERWLSGAPVEARPPSLAYRLRRYLSRRQGAIVASGAAALLAVLVALPFLIQARAQRRAAEQQRDLVERVFELSEDVESALADARATRVSGGISDRQIFDILQHAIERCREFLEANESSHAHLFLGELLREQGQLEAALLEFDTCARIDPGRTRLARERGMTLATLYRDRFPVLGEEPPGELDEWRERGRADLARSLADDEGIVSSDALYARAMLRWLEGDAAGARLGMREVIEIDAGQREAHLSLSRLYLIAGEDALGFRHALIASDLMRGFHPAYVASAMAITSTGDRLEPGQSLLPLEGMRAVLIDYSPLLTLQPGTASAYGMRGQAEARRAMRAVRAGDRLRAWQSLDLAIREYGAALTLEPEHAVALLNRAVCRAELDRVLSESDRGTLANETRILALADYDAALAADPELVAGYFDRALLHLRTSRLQRMTLQPAEASASLDLARADALRAGELAGDGEAWKGRIAELLDDLR